MKKLYLVDASNMFFRAFYAIRQLSNSKGLPTNALYGYISMTVKLLREEKPDYMAYCFDSKETGFRTEIYPEYKANRTEMPEDLVPQMPYFRKITELLGIPVFQQSGIEADDIIGTIAKLAAEKNIEVTIISGDKDFAQLIGPMVKMYDTMKDVIYDVPGVKEKWGVRPEQMIDYLALIGDASDNIPGVAGIGPKTALKLLDQFPSLDEIYKNIEAVKPDKLREKLKSSKEMAYLSQELVTIKTDLNLNELGLDGKITDLELKSVRKDEMIELLNELEFKTFERKIFGVTATPAKAADSVADDSDSSNASAPINAEPSVKTSEIPVTPEKLSQELRDGDTLWALTDERALFIAKENSVYVLQGEIDKFSKVLSNKKIKWKGFDLKSFWKSLKLQNPRALWDHQIACYVIDAGNIGDFSEVYEQNFHLKLPDFPSGSDLLKAHIDLEKVLLEKLEKQNGMRVYLDFDLPLIAVLYSMESKGFLIDKNILKEQSEGLHRDIRQLELSIYDMAGETFNIASPKQLSHVLFEKLKLTPARKTKTGLSTDSDVLLKLEKEHPIARLIIDYRELAKLKSTYVDSLPLLIDPNDNRIHTVFHQTVTSTGRLSSSNPNLQNIPIRTERGNAVRKAFIVEDGFELISADYSQIELRVLAHATEDPGLCRAFANDLDIHAATASEVFGIKLTEVTSEHRRVAKAVNFGLAYGMGPHGLAENLGITRTEAADIINRYFTRFSKVKQYMTDIVEIAKKQGYVETIFGRRRYAPELKSKNPAVRNFGERAVINAPMQGTASDIVKKAMIDIFKKYEGQAIPNGMIPHRMILQVHDELVFEVPLKDSKQFQSEIKQMMENVVTLKVPLKVNIASGKSWFDAH